MSKFTKTYDIQPNEKQVLSLGRAFKVLVQHFVSEGKSVNVKVSDFQDGKVVAVLSVDGRAFDTRVIGVNGGLTVV